MYIKILSFEGWVAKAEDIMCKGLGWGGCAGWVFESLEADTVKWVRGGTEKKSTGKACLHRLKELHYFRSVFEGEFEV